jgi:predicted nucleotidyltransferase
MPVTARDTARHLRACEAAARERGRERAARLVAKVMEARAVLVGRHGAQRAWLFGSLALGEPTPLSDVDLAVEGLPSSAYFQALADLMTLFGGPVDLVRLEQAPASLRERVLSEGREL